MKIGRTQAHVALSVTGDEYRELSRLAPRYGDGRLRCVAVMSPDEQDLHVVLGEGRAFSRSSDPSSNSWRVALPLEDCRATRVPLFGLTPTLYREAGANKIVVQVPAVRAPLKKRNLSTVYIAAGYEPRTERVLSDHVEVIMPPRERPVGNPDGPRTTAIRLLDAPTPGQITNPARYALVHRDVHPDGPRPVDDAELKACIDIYNRATDLGFVPATDAKGRILWWDRRVEGDGQ